MRSLLGRRRPTVELALPDAVAVELVVDNPGERAELRKGADGVWRAALPVDLREVAGHAYHFDVTGADGSVRQIADPFAHITERTDDGLISRFGDLTYRWRTRRFRPPPLEKLVIYEAHLPALSRHPSAPVEADEHRGTFVGARAPAILDHLQRLGVALELLPLHASDDLLGQDWGYFTTSFNAITHRYATDPLRANRELMELVDALHERGVPVILDVVYNHGGELLAQAWGKDVLYRRQPDGYFCEGSGCGPTVQTEHPLVRQMILSSLQHLVRTYRIDGFRFDLGALHDLETMVLIDRSLPGHVSLFSEPWALGGTKWGKGDMSRGLANTRWAIWNDDFREPARQLIAGSGDFHNRDRLCRAIAGSHVDDGGWAVRPQQSVNYLTAHDGHTLADLVGGDKHRQFLGALVVLTSQGVPMLSEGTELMYSKGGEHNSYNRPDLNQLDWGLARTHEDLVDALGKLIGIRKQLPHFAYRRRLVPRAENDANWDIDWIHPTGYPHNDNVNAIGFRLRPPRRWFGRRGDDVIVLLNGSETSAEFHLPDGHWAVLVDGRTFEVDADGLENHPAQGDYYVHPGTGVLLHFGGKD